MTIISLVLSNIGTCLWLLWCIPKPIDLVKCWYATKDIRETSLMVESIIITAVRN